jgi:hypothetical protein
MGILQLTLYALRQLSGLNQRISKEDIDINARLGVDCPSIASRVNSKLRANGNWLTGITPYTIAIKQ